MNFELVYPSPSISAFVRWFWIMDCPAPLPAPYLYHSMADGFPELIFNYSGEVAQKNTGGGAKLLPHSYLFGQASRCKTLELSRSFGIIGVYLYPFAVPALFGCAASETVDSFTDVASLLGRYGAELEEQVITAKTNTDRIAILTAFFHKRISAYKTRDNSVTAAVKYLAHAHSVPNISALASDFNLSLRQFERKFKTYSGFSPMLYSRIIRFQSTLRVSAKYRDRNMAEIAYDHGYYDQSHFIRDFKTFSGIHPGAYFSGKAPGTDLQLSL